MYLMFGREARLPLDMMFQEVAVDDGIRWDKDHKKFVENWHESMKQAMELARANMDKSADYNKRYHDKKAKVVEINVGDRVLVRNYREKGGTGKLKSFWEEAIFVVEEKKEGLPVYKVKNLKKARDTRVVHRNKLMKCEELPLDVFDEPQESKSTKKASSAQNTKKSLPKQHKTTPKNTESEEHDAEVVPETDTMDESNDRDLAILLEEIQDGNLVNIVLDETLDEIDSGDVGGSLVVLDDTMNETVSNHADPDIEISDNGDNISDEVVEAAISERAVYESEPDESVSEADETVEAVLVADGAAGNETLDVAGDDTTVPYGDESYSTVAYDEEPDDTIIADNSTDVAESIVDLNLSEDVDLTDDDQESLRRSGRDRRPAKTLSYDTMGGNPVMKALGRK
jgi:hypothetical protein